MKLNFKVRGQKLELISHPGTIVGGSINYLDAAFEFSSEWNGLDKAAFFTCGDKAFSALLENDKIEQGIDLGAGLWKVHVIGSLVDGENLIKRIPSDEISIAVKEGGGDEGEPFPVVPPSLGEQILQTAEEALRTAKEVKQAADRGEFDGDDYVITEEDYDAIAERAAELVDVPDVGGADISLGVSGATVGQTIVVKEVDENGVPTDWEAADLASGGGNVSFNHRAILYKVTAEDVANYTSGDTFMITIDGFTGYARIATIRLAHQATGGTVLNDVTIAVPDPYNKHNNYRSGSLDNTFKNKNINSYMSCDGSYIFTDVINKPIAQGISSFTSSSVAATTRCQYWTNPKTHPPTSFSCVFEFSTLVEGLEIELHVIEEVSV